RPVLAPLRRGDVERLPVFLQRLAGAVVGRLGTVLGVPQRQDEPCRLAVGLDVLRQGVGVLAQGVRGVQGRVGRGVSCRLDLAQGDLEQGRVVRGETGVLSDTYQRVS